MYYLLFFIFGAGLAGTRELDATEYKKLDKFFKKEYDKRVRPKSGEVLVCMG